MAEDSISISDVLDKAIELKGDMEEVEIEQDMAAHALQEARDRVQEAELKHGYNKQTLQQLIERVQTLANEESE